jgi:hypothetical protein
MPDAAEPRELAACMLAVALASEAKDPNLLEWLCVRAGEYLDQATALESATPAVQQAQQPQPDKKD